MARRLFAGIAVLSALALPAATGAKSSLPAIGKFTPASGPPGTTVTITGSGFTGTTSVKFGSTDALSFAATATQITAVVNHGTVSGPITVTVPSGHGTSKTSFTVLPEPAPSITKLSPNAVPAGTA